MADLLIHANAAATTARAAGQPRLTAEQTAQINAWYRGAVAKGITDKDFELAKKIEDVVHWQPGKKGGALEGTPEKDQRFAYLKYDS